MRVALLAVGMVWAAVEIAQFHSLHTLRRLGDAAVSARAAAEAQPVSPPVASAPPPTEPPVKSPPEVWSAEPAVAAASASLSLPAPALPALPAQALSSRLATPRVQESDQPDLEGLLDAIERDDDATAREIAAELAARNAPEPMERNVQALLDAVDSAEIGHYRSAIRVLSETALDQTRAELVQRIQRSERPDPESAADVLERRRRAAWALGEIGDESDLDPLMQVFTYSEREVRAATAKSIQRIQRRMWEEERRSSN